MTSWLLNTGAAGRIKQFDKSEMLLVTRFDKSTEFTLTKTLSLTEQIRKTFFSANFEPTRNDHRPQKSNVVTVSAAHAITALLLHRSVNAASVS